jgi:hypothetical protein
MSNQTSENNSEQIKNIKEGELNRIVQQQQRQNQQVTNTPTTATSNISETTNKVNTDNINEYQEKNKEILEESIDTVNKYQQQIINTIQSISNNYIELQKNILDTYQSAFLKFIDDTTDNKKSYWNNSMIPLQTIIVYNKINQSIIDNAINNTRTIHEFILGYTETFNKSIELAQKYYSDGLKNYLFNFGKKVK